VKFWEIEKEELRWLLLEACFGNKGRVIAQSRGTFGEIFTFDLGENSFPRYGIAKTPRIDASEPSEQIKIKIVKFIHEINETYKYSNHEIISRHADLKICFGAPFVYSRKRNKTLQDVLLDESPLSVIEAISIIIQLAHGLAYCSSKGLSSHQDMKPDNVLADRIRDHFDMPDDYPLAYRVFICDFGMANAFSVFGKPFGSRPYMAPEQYGHPTTLAKCDVFALGVILHELVSGVHPIGETTRDVWPIPLPEKGNKWKRENVWKAWARGEKPVTLRVS
jgi:serine/threonine protein kinase